MTGKKIRKKAVGVAGNGGGKPSKILTPGQAQADDAAAQHMAMLQRNPLWPLMEQALKDIKQMKAEMSGLMNKHNMVGAMVNAMVDFFTEQGILDPVELKDEDHTFHQHVQNQIEMMQFLPHVVGMVQMGQMEMAECLEEVRQFNAMESRIKQVRGDQFNLHVWLSENPDKLSEEALQALADEFGLVMMSDEEAAENDPNPEGVGKVVKMNINVPPKGEETPDGDDTTESPS